MTNDLFMDDQSERRNEDLKSDLDAMLDFASYTKDEEKVDELDRDEDMNWVERSQDKDQEEAKATKRVSKDSSSEIKDLKD